MTKITVFGMQGKAIITSQSLHYKQLVYTNLLTSGRLNEYLTSVNEKAEDMFYRLVKEYADRQGVTERLKAENQLLWIQKMKNIRACVREVVESEFIYS